MSLINEALKKAQRLRTEDGDASVPASAPGSVAGPAAHIPKHRTPMPARALVVLIGGSLLLAMVGAVLFTVFFKNFSHEPDTHPSPMVAAQPPVAPTAPATAANTRQSASPAAAPAAAAVIPPANEAPVVSVNLPPITAAQSAAYASIPASTANIRPAAPQPTVRRPIGSIEIYELLEKLRVSGVRASPIDPKVIINDRVFRLDDIIDKNTQLRLIRIENLTLVFSDPSGFEYRKNL